MKNTALVIVGFFATAVAGAQNSPDTAYRPILTPSVTATVLADTSVNSAYIANPEALKGLTTETLRPEHAFPVLGTYTATGSSTGDVTITLDADNKGKIWIEGLPQGKFKALLRKAPTTYKIPAQQTEGGKSISEGALFLNPTSGELTIVLGRPYNEADPAATFAAAKPGQKIKAWQYTGAKAAASTAVPQVNKQ